MRRRRVVLRSEPVVKPVIARLRLGGRIKFPIAMPLADVRGVVALGLEYPSDRHLILTQVHHVIARNPVVHAGPIRRTAG